MKEKKKGKSGGKKDKGRGVRGGGGRGGGGRGEGGREENRGAHIKGEERNREYNGCKSHSEHSSVFPLHYKLTILVEGGVTSR